MTVSRAVIQAGGPGYQGTPSHLRNARKNRTCRTHVFVATPEQEQEQEQERDEIEEARRVLFPSGMQYDLIHCSPVTL